MAKGVAITGMGVISSIGNNVDENYQALINSKPGISRITKIKTRHENNIYVGEVAYSNNELISKLGLNTTNVYSRTALLGIMAAKEALQNANIVDIDAHRTGVISATSVGGMDKTEEHYYDFLEKDEYLPYIEKHHCGSSTQDIADYLGIKDYITTISTACSSGANAIMLGARLIKAGILDRVIVGGTDSLSKFTINGFNVLMILSDEHCAPFDKDRKGLNLGEGAAYLVLESDEVVKKENKEVLARVTGYGNANDAFHQTASSDNGEGAFLAMQTAMKIASVSTSEINYINAHGTATPNNDLSESRALIRVFGGEVPKFSSTKAFTGHTLAAAGAIEAVFSVLAIIKGEVFPNLNFSSPIEEENLVPVTNLEQEEINHVLSNSFGFGGNCTSLIFSKA